MDWYYTDNKSRITRETHAAKKSREFHDNESENVSGESIGGAVLINIFVPDAALIQVNTVMSFNLLKARQNARVQVTIDFYFTLIG